MMLRDIRKNKQSFSRVSLIEIGLIIERLMGGAFRSNYCRRKFRQVYYSAVADNSNSVRSSQYCGSKMKNKKNKQLINNK